MPNMDRIGGMVLAPGVAFRRILWDREGGMGEVLLAMVFFMVGVWPIQFAKIVLGHENGILWILQNLVNLYLLFSLAPLLFCFAAALFLVGIHRFRGERFSIETALVGCVYLWVPYGVLGLLGSVLNSFGVDAVLFPNVSWKLFWAQHPSWWMLPLKLLIGYGWSLWLWIYLVRLSMHPDSSHPAVKTTYRWVVVGILFVAYLSSLNQLVANHQRLRPARVGDLVENFTLPLINQGHFTLYEQKGKPIVLEFWATWCPQCLEFLPHLTAWAQKHPACVVVSVHQGGRPEEVREVLKNQKHPPGWVAVIDQEEVVSEALGATTLPAFFVLDAKYRIVAKRVGVPPLGWLEQQLLSIEK